MKANGDVDAMPSKSAKRVTGRTQHVTLHMKLIT